MLSYTSAYVEADRAALFSLSDPAYKILRYLITRADEYGICWPGIRTIGEDTGKCKDTVQSSLEELEAARCIVYIRRNERDPITHQKLPNIYQVNPSLYAVRPECQPQAEACWQEHGGKSLSFPRQDRTNRTNVSQALSSTSYWDQQQQAPLKSEGSLSFSPAPQPPEKEKKAGEQNAARPDARRQNSSAAQQRSQNQNFRASNKSTSISVRKERPVYPRIDPVAERLPSDSDEWIAERCRTEAQINIRIARGLVVYYGAAKVESALNLPSLQSANHKGGLLRWLLLAKVVDPTDQEAFYRSTASSPDGKQYISGKYADSIEH